MYDISFSVFKEYDEHNTVNFNSCDQVHICLEMGCFNSALYGTGKNRQFCEKHAAPEHRLVVSVVCQHRRCKKAPIFAPPNYEYAVYCFTHAPSHFVNVSRKCLIKSCQTASSYGILNTSIKQYCFKHKPKEYFNILKTCVVDGCTKHPLYGKSHRTAEYCEEHKIENYPNVVNGKCECGRRATHTLQKNNNYPIVCEDHVDESSVRIYRLCLEKGCEDIPYYGHPHLKKAKYCLKHTNELYSDDYINQKSFISL